MSVAVPRAWAGETVAILATGPSLTQADVDACRGLRVIAVNDAFRLAPWADCLYATDVSWWLTHQQTAPLFAGPKWSVDHVTWDASRRERFPHVQRLANTGVTGIDTDPTGLRHGGNSGYAALNLAVHYGAARILLLGYDLQHGDDGRTHFFGNHPGSLNNRSPYHQYLANFATTVAPLRALGIDVVNCSPRSALSCFPLARLHDALAKVAA